MSEYLQTGTVRKCVAEAWEEARGDMASFDAKINELFLDMHGVCCLSIGSLFRAVLALPADPDKTLLICLRNAEYDTIVDWDVGSGPQHRTALYQALECGYTQTFQYLYLVRRVRFSEEELKGNGHASVMRCLARSKWPFLMMFRDKIWADPPMRAALDVNAPVDGWGGTALHMAVANDEPHLRERIQVLLDMGARCDKLDHTSTLPRDYLPVNADAALVRLLTPRVAAAMRRG